MLTNQMFRSLHGNLSDRTGWRHSGPLETAGQENVNTLCLSQMDLTIY